MKINIKKAGMMTTVQDLGRRYYLSQGVPVSGAMDSLSATLANLSLGNDAHDAVVEFTQSGASFTVAEDVLVCFCGEGASLFAGTVRLPSNRPLFIPSGADIYLEHLSMGCRSYLAVAGGWDVPEVLGSRSTYLTGRFGGLEGRCLKQKDTIKSTGKLTATAAAIRDSLKGDRINYPAWSVARDLFLPVERKKIRAVRGREFDWFGGASTHDLLSQDYILGHHSDRMGYQLQGRKLKRTLEGELLSTAVTPGTIQVTNDGQLVLLMADCQTTGGYPRIAQVSAVDLPLCAQLKTGDIINFEEISWKESEKLYIQRQLDLHKLAVAIRQRYHID